jgi:hypothetical protein
MNIPEKYRLKSEQKLLCKLFEDSKEFKVLKEEINKMIPEQEKDNILLAEDKEIDAKDSLVSFYLLFLPSIEANEVYKEINSFIRGFMAHWFLENESHPFEWTEQDRIDYLTFMETH